MKIFTVSILAALAIAALSWSAAQAANVPGWCANSGYDNGPPRSRGPGKEPGDCQSIWRRSRYRGTDPDPFIRLQLMRYRPVSKKERRATRK
jgi:hypothetical protein